MMTKRIVVGLALIIMGNICLAQDEAQVDPNSTLRIQKYEHMYKVRVWRAINLREKQNKGFFAKRNEITKLIIKAAKAGELPNIYESDLVTPIPKEKFLGDLMAQAAAKVDLWSPTQGYGKDDKVSFNGVNYVALDDSKSRGPSNDFCWKRYNVKVKTPFSAWDPTKAYKLGERVAYEGGNYEAIKNLDVTNPSTNTDEWDKDPGGKEIPVEPDQISKLTLVEDVIFDKRRSRLYYDILAIQLLAYIPTTDKANPDKDQDLSKGSFKPLGWVLYKDLEKVFRDPQHVSEAIWFNRYNMAEKRNYADAFLLRLFHATIEKVENPDDETIFESFAANGRTYREAVYATEWEEMKLMEKEHNLWEY